MDRRLIGAAQTGNVELLLQLIQNDPLLLFSVSLSGGDTPLHIASLAGHLDFVQEILKLRKEFAQELNQDGLSPLHIASANGYVEIVKEILKIDHNLCLVRGREGRIPLHYAAIKGRVGVMHELLLSSPDSVIETTARGETSLHLVVKNNQFQVLRLLVDHVKEFGKEELLNYKDEQGNTILHLAVSRKQYEVLDLLLRQNSVVQAAMEVNCMNKSGLTPLDTLMLFQSEAGDREIEEIMRQAGAIRASQNNNDIAVNSRNELSVQEQAISPARQLRDYFKYNNTRDSPSEVRHTILVVASLIVVATYQAVLNLLGAQSGAN